MGHFFCPTTSGLADDERERSMKFKPQDRVEVALGGPATTVERSFVEDGEERVDCVWSVRGKVERETFVAAALRLHVDAVPSVFNPNPPRFG